ncbi:MAG TPA: hypothetical protein HA272_06890 [Methanoregula sp.]|nr:hypothetical protein [Methanoregula sp.]
MQQQTTSGNGRWILIIVVLVMLACIAGAGAADCASGCTCLSPADAGTRGLTYCGGTVTACSDNARAAMYCYGSGIALVTPRITLVPLPVTTTAVPACPAGCECLTDAVATNRYGSYTRCSANICGYEPVLTHVADPIPKYCVKKPDAGTCPGDCECMMESAAADKFGSYEQCNSNPCYSVVTGSATVNAYCFRQAAVLPVAALCPSGCACLLEEVASGQRLDRCDPNAAPCAYKPQSPVANIPGSEKPLYCYRMPEIPTLTPTATPVPVCPDGCSCMSEATAKDRFETYSRCSETVCGTEGASSLTHMIPQYCFRQGTAVTTTTVPPAGSCTYDLQKNACSGSCQATGEICRVNTLIRDTSGAIIAGECHCKAGGEEPAPSDPCACDPTWGGCTGTCAEGQTCWMTDTTADASGKLSCTTCACTQICTLGADNTCSGACPAGGTCTATVITGDDGTENAGCSCGLSSTAVAPKPEDDGGVIGSIGNFFRSLFGWK